VTYSRLISGPLTSPPLSLVGILRRKVGNFGLPAPPRAAQARSPCSCNQPAVGTREAGSCWRPFLLKNRSRMPQDTPLIVWLGPGCLRFACGFWQAVLATYRARCPTALALDLGRPARPPLRRCDVEPGQLEHLRHGRWQTRPRAGPPTRY